MTGQALMRALFIITLIVTANAVKPFSVSNVTSQFLSTARTVKMLLPDSAQTGFSNANILASTLTRSWFDEDLSEPIWYGEPKILASQNSPVDKVGAEPTAAPVKMSKAIIDRNTATRRLVARKTDEDDPADLMNDLAETDATPIEEEATLSPTAIAFMSQRRPVGEYAAWSARPAFTRSVNFESPAQPVSLPEIDRLLECALSKVRPFVGSIPAYSRPPHITSIRQTPACDDQTSKPIRLIKLIEAKRVSSVLSSMLECEEETTEIKSTVEIQVMSPPEESSYEVHIPQPVFPLQMAPAETSSCNPLD